MSLKGLGLRCCPPTSRNREAKCSSSVCRHVNLPSVFLFDAREPTSVSDWSELFDWRAREPITARSDHDARIVNKHSSCLLSYRGGWAEPQHLYNCVTKYTAGEYNTVHSLKYCASKNTAEGNIYILFIYLFICFYSTTTWTCRLHNNP